MKTFEAWIPELKLDVTDKNDIVMNNKLSSNHIEAVNKQ
jgi:hypothetical protein